MASLLALYRRHLLRRHLQPSTIERYLTDLRAYERGLGVGLLEATPRDVEAFLDTRDHAARSRYRWLSEISRFYQWAIAAGHAQSDPTATIARPRLSRLLPRPSTDSEIDAAIDTAGSQMAAWLTLMSYAGLRCAEVATLDRSSIGSASLRVVGKGGHERVVPMHPRVRQALDRAVLAKSGPAFRTADGRPFSPKEVSRRTSAYLEGLGVSSTGHQLRHAFGTRAYRVSRNLRAVQELMGHQDPSTTASYAAVTAEDLASVVAAMD